MVNVKIYENSGPVPDYAQPEEISRRIKNAKKIVRECGGNKKYTLIFKISSGNVLKKKA